jgi:hypothetical protein
MAYFTYYLFMKTICLRGAQRRGGGVSTLWTADYDIYDGVVVYLSLVSRQACTAGNPPPPPGVDDSSVSRL